MLPLVIDRAHLVVVTNCVVCFDRFGPTSTVCYICVDELTQFCVLGWRKENN